MIPLQGIQRKTDLCRPLLSVGKEALRDFARNLFKRETKCYEVIMLPVLVACLPLAAFEAFHRFSRNSVWMLYMSNPIPHTHIQW